MAVLENSIPEDLEDGEIESDEETEAKLETNIENINAGEINDNNPSINEKKGAAQEDCNRKELIKDNRKKKKNKSGKEKYREKNKKYKNNVNVNVNVPEDDFAGSIEKAVRKALKKEENESDRHNDVASDRRRYKKRKKYDNDGPDKKKKKKEAQDELDEDEMMCVRGASPVNRPSTPNECRSDERDSYASDSSHESPKQRPSRQMRRRNKDFRDRNKNDRDRRKGAHPMQDPDGVCLYFMQGKCHKGDDCAFSHNAEPPRKLELCKFYLMECCAKRDKCLYMHSDFPCKYYHTGLPCIYKDECKFAHGKPLSESLRLILLKHIESAPKEILGEFPRLSREAASMMIHNTYMKLMQQYSPGSLESSENKNDEQNSSLSPNQPTNDKQTKATSKIRQSRWQNEYNFNSSSSSDVLSIKNLTGVLTARQIAELTKLGIESLNQLSQLTVMQLNNLGLTLQQINDIQLNTMSIQKLGLINDKDSENQVNIPGPPLVPGMQANQDLDLRVPPSITLPTDTTNTDSDLLGKDVDMRFQLSLPKLSNNPNESFEKNNHKYSGKNDIDIDQYKKDALKFLGKEEIIKSEEDTNQSLIIPKQETTVNQDVDHRVLKYADENNITHKLFPLNSENPDTDTDIRFLQPELIKRPDKRIRRSTTDDDEEHQLQIDEKWYSSDEDKSERKSVEQSPKQSSPVRLNIEPTAVLNKLGDLSKINISDEVTKLLNTMKSNLQAPPEKPKSSPDHKEEVVRRDPRTMHKKSPDLKSPDISKIAKPSHKKIPKISIYECLDGEPTDGRRRADVDLRPNNEFRLPSLGDTDLRQTPGSGDIDFRLSLPFKAIPNYTPASEINGSITCHPPIHWKLKTIHIPRPDYRDIRNSMSKAQAILDPRLRKVFRLSTDESSSDNEKHEKLTKNAPAPRSDPRADPRRKPKEKDMEPKSSSLDLQVVIQNSAWYKELSSTQKIMANQQLATVSALIKNYQQEKTSLPFDMSPIQGNPMLTAIFTNLGITIDEKANISYVTQDSLMAPPVPFNQNINNLHPNTMNMMSPPMGMPNMGSMNMGNMGGFNGPYPESRGGPGLLGIAPNVPHNFDNPNFSGIPNFMPDNFGNNMQYGGPMDGDQVFRNQGRGGFRGRGGNERWNRGGMGRNPRDRRNFSERGNWKGDRR